MEILKWVGIFILVLIGMVLAYKLGVAIVGEV